MNILKSVPWLIVKFFNAPEKRSTISAGFVHAKLASVSKCSITPSYIFIIALLFDVRTICILLRHEDATVIIWCMTTGGIRDSGTLALTDISCQLSLATWG